MSPFRTMMFKVLFLNLFFLAVILKVEGAPDPRLAIFPLWNSSWVICQGDNGRIFPSVAPTRPKTIMYVSFTEYYPEIKYQVRIRWADCNHTDYACTADLVDDILTQFGKNDITVSDSAINNDSIINIIYNTYNDTVWSLDKALSALPPNYDEFYRKTDGDPVALSGSQGRYELRNNPVYTQEQPTAWARRVRIDPEDKKKYSIDIEVEVSEGKTEIQSVANAAATSSTPTGASDDFTDYCNNQYCFEGVHDYDFKTDNLGYWQVHLFPFIAYYPRDAATGQPNFKVPPMGMKEAFEKKRQSIDNPKNINLKDYRNPYLSDSASSIISFSFTDDGSTLNPTNKRSSIWLSGSAISSKMQYEHFPTRMFRVESAMEQSVIQAILQSYSEDDAHAQEMKTLDSRCPGWQIIDAINSKYIFPVKDRINGRFTQDDSYNTGIFTYNNCPCTYIEPYGMTAAQLRKFVFKAVPSCSYTTMQKAFAFYKKLQSILNAPDDQKLLNGRIQTVLQLMAVRENIYATDKTRDWAANETNCPTSWVDALP